jgi:CBS domain-containing protein
MIARELLSDVIPALVTSDPVKKALDRMAEFKVSHLPVVNNEQLLGVVSEDDIIGVIDYEDAIGSLGLSLYKPYVDENQHVYEVIRTAYNLKLSLVPVVDAASNYLGAVSVNAMVEYIATLTSVKEPGAIIVIEISNRNNSLAHIAQVVESDNAQVLSSYIRSFPDSVRLEVTLKVNKTDITSIVASFNRYDYTVLATYNDIRSRDQVLDRYEQLMNYLSL